MAYKLPRHLVGTNKKTKKKKGFEWVIGHLNVTKSRQDLELGSYYVCTGN